MIVISFIHSSHPHKTGFDAKKLEGRRSGQRPQQHHLRYSLCFSVPLRLTNDDIVFGCLRSQVSETSLAPFQFFQSFANSVRPTAASFSVTLNPNIHIRATNSSPPCNGYYPRLWYLNFKSPTVSHQVSASPRSKLIAQVTFKANIYSPSTS